MVKKLDDLFYSIRFDTLRIIKEKDIDINALAFDLGIDQETFINNYIKRIDDFTFYLEAISLVENWEG